MKKFACDVIWILDVFFQQGLFQASLATSDAAVLGGMRNDHSSTVKKPGFGVKSTNNKSGHIRRPSQSNSHQPPQKVILHLLIDLLKTFYYLN